MQACQPLRDLLSHLNHEDDLLNYRTVWLLTSQAFLLVGYVLLDKKNLPPSRFDHHLAFEILGLLSTIFIFSAIMASEVEFVHLRTMMQKDALSAASDCQTNPRLLPHGGVGAGLLTPILLALAFLLTWSVFFFRGWLPAILMALSGVLFSAFSVLLGEERHGFTIVYALLAAAIVALSLAVVAGVRSIRLSPRT